MHNECTDSVPKKYGPLALFYKLVYHSVLMIYSNCVILAVSLMPIANTYVHCGIAVMVRVFFFFGLTA
jgi:hypothetical protein